VTQTGSASSSDIDRKRKRASEASRRGYTRRRRAIIAAAAEVFHAKGLANTSLGDISEKLDVDRAGLYYYFKDKNELFRAVILDSIESLVTEVQGIAARQAQQRSKLVEILALVVRSFADDYPALHVYLQEDMRRLNRESLDDVDPEAVVLSELADTYMSVLEDLIVKGIESGEFRPVGDPHVITMLVQGSINWMHRWYDPLEGPPAEEIARIMVDVMIDGLAATS